MDYCSACPLASSSTVFTDRREAPLRPPLARRAKPSYSCCMEVLPAVPILVISGGRGAGKTSLVLGLARELAASGHRIGGIASPSERGGDGRPLAIDALDLATGERRLLATRGTAPWQPVPEERGGRPGRSLSFSEKTFAWAEAVFRAAAKPGFDLVALDEIGPLELDEGRGFFPLVGLVAAMAGLDRRFVLTVRESRAEKLLAFFGRDRAAGLSLDGGDRDALLHRLIRWCGEPAVSGP